MALKGGSRTSTNCVRVSWQLGTNWISRISALLIRQSNVKVGVSLRSSGCQSSSSYLFCCFSIAAPKANVDDNDPDFDPHIPKDYGHQWPKALLIQVKSLLDNMCTWLLLREPLRKDQLNPHIQMLPAGTLIKAGRTASEHRRKAFFVH